VISAINRRAQQIAHETGTEIRIRRVEHLESALATPEIQRQIEAVAESLRLKTQHLPSGAGHDAQQLAKIGPTGMIFVPSVAGISHSPKESTSWDDCTNGAYVLLQAVLRVDKL